MITMFFQSVMLALCCCPRLQTSVEMMWREYDVEMRRKMAVEWCGSVI